MNFIGVYNLPLAVTVAGLFAAVAACIFSFNRMLPGAVICFILSGLCDLFDGVVARKTKLSETEKRFGLYIDSSVDAVSFGMVPVIILLHSGFNQPADHILFCFYSFSATMRLAYFNLLQHNSGNGTMRYYTGLPVTYSALFLPTVLSICTLTDKATAQLLVRLTIFLLGFFYILKVRIRKPGGIFYIIFPLTGMALIIFWLGKALK